MGPATATRPLVVLSRTPASTRELICRINYSRRHPPGKRHSETDALNRHSNKGRAGAVASDVDTSLGFCARSGLIATLRFVHCRELTHFPMDSSFANDKKTQLGTFLSAEIKRVALSQLQNGLELSARRPFIPSASGVGEKKARRDVT